MSLRCDVLHGLRYFRTFCWRFDAVDLRCNRQTRREAGTQSFRSHDPSSEIAGLPIGEDCTYRGSISPLGRSVRPEFRVAACCETREMGGRMSVRENDATFRPCRSAFCAIMAFVSDQSAEQLSAGCIKLADSPSFSSYGSPVVNGRDSMRAIRNRHQK